MSRGMQAGRESLQARQYVDLMHVQATSLVLSCNTCCQIRSYHISSSHTRLIRCLTQILGSFLGSTFHINDIMLKCCLNCPCNCAGMSCHDLTCLSAPCGGGCMHVG